MSGMKSKQSVSDNEHVSKQITTICSSAVVVSPVHGSDPGGNNSVLVSNLGSVVLEDPVVVRSCPVSVLLVSVSHHVVVPSVEVSLVVVSPGDDLSPSSGSLGSGTSASGASGWAWVAGGFGELLWGLLNHVDGLLSLLLGRGDGEGSGDENEGLKVHF